MPLTVAYIAEGKLFLKRGDLQPEQIESPFAQSIADRAARDQERNAWKTKGAIDGMPQGMLWQFQGFAPLDPSMRRVQFRSLARAGKTGELMYSLETAR